MSLYALPSLIEEKVSDYITSQATGVYEQLTAEGNVSGTYPVYPFFRSAELTFPAVIIKAGKFSELEPETHVYQGDLAVAVITAIDSCVDPLATHDAKVAEVYEAMASGFLGAVNGGDSLHVYGFYSTSYDQDIEDNSYKSLMQYSILAQTAALQE